jgi:hypothetical protein
LYNFLFIDCLDTELCDQYCQDGKVFGDYVGFGQMVKHFADDSLLTLVRVESKAQDQLVKLPQQFWVVRVADEGFQSGGKVGKGLVQLDQRDEEHQFGYQKLL